MSRYLRFLIPLAVFGILVAFLGRGLYLNPREVPSPLIGKPVPVFELPQLHDASSHFSSRDMLGKVWLLNVWASWCAGCRQEHRDLMTFAGQNIAPLVGLNYKELRGDGAIDSSQLEGITLDEELAFARQRTNEWLGQLGNPYLLTVFDLDGRAGIDFGVYGVPETFVIDKEGIIRYKHIGAVTEEALENKILPLVKQLQGL
ncbi:MAG TPA: DsbE family thiol:disulfide interchange protein [Gammaproteobacteria bacterium]